MNTQDFKTYIKNIRKEALEIGYSISTMDGINVKIKSHKNVKVKKS